MFPKRLPCTPGSPNSWRWKNHSSPVELEQLHNVEMTAASWEGKTWVVLSASCSLHFFVKQAPDTIRKQSFSFLSDIPFSFLPPCLNLTMCPYRMEGVCSCTVDEEGWGLFFLFMGECIMCLFTIQKLRALSPLLFPHPRSQGCCCALCSSQC